MVNVTLPVDQDLVVVLNPDGAFEGGPVVTGADTRPLPVGDPDELNPMAVAVVYPGGLFTFNVALDTDISENQLFINEDIVITPQGAQSLGVVVRGIPK